MMARFDRLPQRLEQAFWAGGWQPIDLALSPDGTRLFLAGPAGVKALQLPQLGFARWAPSTATLQAFALSPDGRRLALLEREHHERRIRLLEPQTLEELGGWQAAPAPRLFPIPASRLYFSCDGAFLTLWEPQSVEGWQIDDGHRARSCQTPEMEQLASITGAVSTPSARPPGWCAERGVWLRVDNGGPEPALLLRRSGASSDERWRLGFTPSAFALDPAGALLALGNRAGEVGVYDLVSGRRLPRLQPLPGPVQQLRFGAGRLCAASGSSVRSWDSESWVPGAGLELGTSAIDEVLFLGEERLLARARDGRFFCWEVSSGAPSELPDDPAGRFATAAARRPTPPVYREERETRVVGHIRCMGETEELSETVVIARTLVAPARFEPEQPFALSVSGSTFVIEDYRPPGRRREVRTECAIRFARLCMPARRVVLVDRAELLHVYDLEGNELANLPLAHGVPSCAAASGSAGHVAIGYWSGLVVVLALS